MDAVTQPKLFISYAHADGQTTINDFWTALREYLKKPERKWEKWDDKEILVGQEWDKTIGQALEKGCNCCLLLISDLFAKSSYIMDKEWPKTLSRYKEQGIVFFPVVFGVLDCGLEGLPNNMRKFQVYWPTVTDLYRLPPTNISNPDQVRLCYKEVKSNDAARDRFLSSLARQMNKRFDELRDQTTKLQRLEKEEQQAEAEHNAEKGRKRKEIEARRKSDEKSIGPRPQFTTTPPPRVAPPQEPAPPQKITNSIGMEFVLIPAGTFVMGSRLSPKELVQRYGGKEEWYEWEKPHHTVKIEQSYYLQTTTVTQGQWKRLTGDTPSRFKDCGDDCPVEQVSWIDVLRFIEELNHVEKTKDYRLPSEVEWEYACRADSETDFSFGSYVKRLDEFAWYSDNSDSKTHPVGMKKPNDLGLHDMHGNVWEWVEDDWHEDYNGAPEDGRAWVDNPRGTARVMRGGSWDDVADDCRSADRSGNSPGYRNSDIGFRLARSVALGP